MKIIDIFDSRDATALTGRMLDDRLRALAWRGESVAALRRKGPGADRLRTASDISLLTTRFGLGFNMTFAAKMRRLAGDADRFIVHTHSPAHAEKAIMASRAMRCVTVGTVLELPSVEEIEKTPRTTFVARGTDMLIFHSATDRNKFISIMEGTIDEGQTTVLPPAVSLAPAAKEADNRKELVIVWGGEIDSIVSPGLTDIISAMGAAHHIPVKLLLAGQGVARQSVPLIRKARELGLDERIEWLGSTELTDEIILRADAAIIPSPADRGAFILGARAMGAGLPLIIPSGERMEELAQEAVNAVVYTPGDIESLSETLSRLTSDTELRATLGRQARLKAEAQSDLNFGIDRLLTLYSTLLVK